MPGYETVLLNVAVGEHEFRLKSLRDRQQYADPDGRAKRVGICSASWPHFGWLWPSAIVLAEAMNEIDVEGRRILEVGCGLGLPSLVLKRNGADITASDHHPLAEEFLDENAKLNRLPPIDFVNLRWDEPAPDLGRFDVIIGSDILYERGHAELLAQLIERHSARCAEVWIGCPGRGYVGRFKRALRAQGFEVAEKREPVEATASPRRHASRLFRLRRCRGRCRPFSTERVGSARSAAVHGQWASPEHTAAGDLGARFRRMGGSCCSTHRNGTKIPASADRSARHDGLPRLEIPKAVPSSGCVSGG